MLSSQEKEAFIETNKVYSESEELVSPHFLSHFLSALVRASATWLPVARNLGNWSRRRSSCLLPVDAVMLPRFSFFPCFTYLCLFFISLATPDAPAASINRSAVSTLFRVSRGGIFARFFSILSQPFPVDSLWDCPSVAFNLSSTLQYSLSILGTPQVLRGGRRRHDCVNC